MKIAFFETENWEKEYLSAKLLGHELSFFDEPLNFENISKAKSFEIISPFVYSAIDEKVLENLPDLKFIPVRATGFDNIAVAKAKEKNIFVSNVPFYGENRVAAHTFALILDLSRKLYRSIERTKKEGEFSVDGLQGFDLKGRTLGIIGAGHIGQHVARIARGFEMNVLAFDVKQDKKLSKKLGFEYVSFEDLLKNSDIITLHAPYNESTKHLINSSNINLIKKGAYLINTARGGLVETQALYEALADGILAGAGLDVLEEEFFIKEEAQLLSKEFSKEYNLKTALQNHVLLERDDVIITPHNAFNSKEALERILDTTIENISAFLKGKPINLVG